MNIKERFINAIDYLYKSNCNLATEVTKLGHPSINNSIPTAGVYWDKIAKQIRFDFNEKFASTLNDEQFAFVVAHEAMHVINCHVFLIANKIKKIKQSSTSNLDKNSQINEFMVKINVAADCVVNDSLVNLYNFQKIFDKPSKDAPTIIYGKNTVGIDCHNLSVGNVYKLLPQMKFVQFDVHDWESFLDPSGNVDKEYTDKLKDLFSRNVNNSSLKDEESFKIEEAIETLKQHSNCAGTEKLGQRREITRTSRRHIKFDKLLLELIDSKFIEDKWNRPSRKLSAFYPKTILPKFEEKEIENVFVAIDASGSIDMQALSLFVDVVRNAPKRFRIKAISFDTSVYEFNVYSDDRPQGGGGTNFSIIEDYIQKTFKKYPTVFVLTDGHGTPVNPKFKNKWCFLLYGDSSTVYCKDMKWYKIEEMFGR